MSNRTRAAFLTVSAIIIWTTLIDGQDGVWLGYAIAAFWLFGNLLYLELEELDYSVCASRKLED